MNDDALINILITIPHLVCKAIVLFSSGEKLEDTRHFIIGETKRLGEKIRYEDINKSLRYSKAVISKQIKQLIDSGYLITYDDETNRNRKWVELTEKGKDYANTWREVLNKAGKEILKDFTEEEKAALEKYLKIFYINLPESEYLESEKASQWVEIIHFFVLIYRYTQHYFRTAVDKDGYLVQELRILAMMDETRDWISFKKIENHIRLSQPKVVRAISNLNQKNLTIVRTDPQDKRKKQAKMTDQGIVKVNELYDFYEEVKKNGLEHFTKEDQTEFLRILKKWQKNVNSIINE